MFVLFFFFLPRLIYFCWTFLLSASIQTKQFQHNLDLMFIVITSKLKLFIPGNRISYTHTFSTTLLSPTNGNRIMRLRIITVTGGQDNRGHGSCWPRTFRCRTKHYATLVDTISSLEPDKIGDHFLSLLYKTITHVVSER